MSLAIITAMTRVRVIGKGNTLPWHIPEEIKLFRTITTGHTVIMGRNTYESIGKALPNRRNIVVTSQPIAMPNIETVKSIDDAIEKSSKETAFVIGGAKLYAAALPKAKRMLISHIKEEYAGDVFFPLYNEQDWGIIDEKEYDEFIFRIYERQK